MTDAPVPFFARLWLAILCAFRVAFNPALAGRVRVLLVAPEGNSREAQTATATATEADATEADATETDTTTVSETASAAARAAKSDEDDKKDALGLLALLQREGRLVDFLKQDIVGFGDGDVGAAARVVHAGCRKALLGHFELSPIRSETEGAAVTVPEGFDGRSIKLTGNVRGNAPYRGVLRHAGWRVDSVRLPALIAGYDARIIAPAEVEL